jgi:hypothetical protein
MKNVTISMDEELYRLTRIEAAKAGISMSRFLASAAKSKIDAAHSASESEARNGQLEAVKAFLAGPKWSIMENGRMPTAEERNARR